ncbi:MAG: VWA domain-containing protein [Candidatus Sumerlaeia bacterium]|nr:VWA domain-containing protein [Candidatus Sumerlaeia bacterium]
MINEFRFLHPWVLAGIVLVPLLLWRQLRAARRETPTFLFSDTAVLRGLGATWRTRAVASLPWLRAMVLSLGVVALARPQLGTIERNVQSLGVDIALVLDVSGSMQAVDLKPNRLEAAKLAATEFVRNRPSDRLSVVVFATSAALLCPPTMDRGAVETFINTIYQGIITNESTAIGTGLGLGVSQLKDSEAKSRVVILLTDGVNNSGRITPAQAAEAAQALGVRVYTIGVGGEGPAYIPQKTPFGGIVNQPINAEVDERGLTEIAEATGGRYFRAVDTESLLRIYDEINAMEKTEISVDETADFNERFAGLWVPALLLLGLELLLRAFLLVRIP